MGFVLYLCQHSICLMTGRDFDVFVIIEVSTFLCWEEQYIEFLFWIEGNYLKDLVYKIFY